MRLNTKLCCFFCLKQVGKEQKTDLYQNDHENINDCLFELKNLCRFLKIRAVSENASESYKSIERDCSEAKNFEVLLCDCCRNVYRNFSKLFMKLERIEMEISYWTDKIQGAILKACRTPEVVQEYSKRMTSDVDTLSKLPVIDKLRKEIANKCGSVRTHRTKMKVVLTKINEGLVPFHNQNVVKTNSDSVPIFSSFETVKNEPIFAPDFSRPQSPSSPPPSPSVISNKLGGSHKPILIGIHYIKTGNKFKCLSCNKVLTSKMGTRFHIRTRHFGKRYRCHKCKNQFTLNINLKKHLKQCNGVKPIRKTGYALGKHVTINIQTGKYDCSSCGVSLPTRDSARHHYINTHIRKKSKCPNCTGEFKYLKKHLKVCKPKIKRELKSHDFTCDKCKAFIKTYDGFKRHVERCKSNQLTRVGKGTKSVFIPETGNYNCRICSKEFNCPKRTIYHYDTVHLQRTYKCSICEDAVFTKESFYRKHRKSCRKNDEENTDNNDNARRDKAKIAENAEGVQIKTEADPTSDCEKEDGSSPNAEDSN